MPLSMTGFGSDSKILPDGDNISVEIKTLNQRYLEISTRIPKSLNNFEHKIRLIIKKYIKRGKVNIRITINGKDEIAKPTKIDIDIAERVFENLNILKKHLKIKDSVSITNLLSFPEIFIFENDKENNQDIHILELIDTVLKNVYKMRSDEGKLITCDIKNKLQLLEDMIIEIKRMYPIILEEKKSHIKSLFSDISKDFISQKNIELKRYIDDRFFQEIAILTDKMDIEEELIRLDSHIIQFYKLNNEDRPVGKTMDFLLQEILRETNTIASKSQNITITKNTINMKEIIEKLREQVQNIE